jgi:hypothetical protein
MVARLPSFLVVAPARIVAVPCLLAAAPASPCTALAFCLMCAMDVAVNSMTPDYMGSTSKELASDSMELTTEEPLVPDSLALESLELSKIRALNVK